MTQQLICPNPNVWCRPGYCLEYVRSAAGLPARYGSATEAWENSQSQHQDWDIPGGLWVPIWFSIDIEPAGHVAWYAPDGTVWSASDLTNTPHHHPNIQDLIDYYARWGKMTLTYLGWTEDVAGFPVITNTEEDDMTLSPETLNVLNETWQFAKTAAEKATEASSEATNAKVAARDAVAAIGKISIAGGANADAVNAVVDEFAKRLKD